VISAAVSYPDAGRAADEVATLIRYAQSIQRRRWDYGNEVLSLRGADLRALAMMFGISVEQLIQRLLGWGCFGGGLARSRTRLD
jgi:hypothetical protein